MNRIKKFMSSEIKMNFFFEKTRSSIFFLMTICLAFIYCGKEHSDVSGRKITFWHSFVSATIPALEDLIAKFEAAHPDIKVQAQYVPTGDALIQKLITAIQSHNTPDISWIHTDWLDKLVDAKAIYPLTTFIEGEIGLSAEELSDFFPALLTAGTYNDSLFSIPMEATVLALIYNKDLFRKAGLDPEHPPATWNELVEFSRKLTLDTDHDGKIDQFGFYVPVFPASGVYSIWTVLQWTPFLWQAGGEEMDSDHTIFCFASPAGIAALKLWKQLYTENHMRIFALSHDMGFASKRLAMVMDGPWNLPRYRKMENVDWAVASLPAGPVKQATYLAGEQLVIFRQSSQPEAAWTFIKFITRPEIQAEFSQRSGYLPVRQSSLKMESYKQYLETDPALKTFVSLMAIGQTRVPLKHFRAEINHFLAEAIEKSLVGEMPVDSALIEAEKKANRLFQENSDQKKN